LKYKALKNSTDFTEVFGIVVIQPDGIETRRLPTLSNRFAGVDAMIWVGSRVGEF